MAVSLTVAGWEMIGDDPGVGLRRQTLSFEQVITARAVCSFNLIHPAHVPVVEETVVLTIDSVVVFGGIVTRVEAEDWGDRDTMAYKITCSDWMEVADGILINDIFPGGTLKQTLQFFLTRLEDYGFTLDPAQTDGPTFPAQAYPFQTYTTALNNLTAAAGGWTWTISPTKVLGAYPWGAVPAPWEIEPEDLSEAVMERTRDQSASVVWVRFGGGEGSPNPVTWTTPGNGTHTYQTPYTSISPGPNVVTVDGVSVPVFPAPGSGWRWSGNTLYQDVTTPVLDATHTIAITFTVVWPSYAVATVPAAVYEKAVIVDAPNVFNPVTAQALAETELERRSTFPQIWKLITRRPGLMAGQSTLLTLGQYGVYLIPVLLTSVRLLHAGRTSEGEPWWRFDIDAIGANKSRSNWIDFWRKSGGSVGVVSGGGGGGGTGPPGPPGPPGGGGVAPMFMGGSRTVTLGGCDGWHPIIQFNDVILDPNAAGIWTLRCHSWVLDDSYTVNVRVVEIEGSFPGYEAAVIVGTGTATNATDWNTFEAFQEFTCELVKGTPEYYRAEMQLSDPAGEAYVAGAYIYPSGTTSTPLPPAAGPKYYLTRNVAAGYTPPTIRGAWDQPADAVTQALTQTKYTDDPIGTKRVFEASATLDWDVLLYRGVSPPLAAQTISGTLDVVLGCRQQFSTSHHCFHVHAYVTQGDTDTVRGTLLSDYRELVAAEWPQAAPGNLGRAFASPQALTPVALTAGDRLVVEIGYVARNTSALSNYAEIGIGTSFLGGAAVDLTVGSEWGVSKEAGYLVFSANITEAA